MSYGVEMPVDATGTGTLVPSKIDLSGWGFLGAQLGVFAKATKSTRLGLTYRNKVAVNMSGDTTMGGQSLHTEMEFAAPHTFKLGVAQSLLDDRFLLALDLKFSMYKESSKELVVKTDIPGAGTISTTQTLDWKNTLGVYAGGEYRFAPQGPAVRLGYSLAQSATPNSYANPILPPPGIQQSISAGAGMSFSIVDVDLGGYYLFGGKHVQPVGYPSGNYDMDGILVALSGNLHW
jgi:long-subunit fatty acid transport protein